MVQPLVAPWPHCLAALLVAQGKEFVAQEGGELEVEAGGGFLHFVFVGRGWEGGSCGSVCAGPVVGTPDGGCVRGGVPHGGGKGGARPAAFCLSFVRTSWCWFVN